MKDKIIAALREYGDSPSELSWSKKTLTHEGLSIAHKETHGGHEGAGEDHWVVLQVTEIETGNITFWKVPGFYQSYNGAELEIDNIYEVKPVEKTITVWE